jgi:hypothetical protein
MSGSLANSVGTHIYTGGQTDVSISFGIGSFNMSTGQVRGLWNWGDLSTGEKIGYSLGAFANFTDIMGAINQPNETHQLQTENTSLKKGFNPGHSAFERNGKTSLSYGPAESNNHILKKLFGSKATTNYKITKQRPELNVGLNSKVVNGLHNKMTEVPYAAGFGIQCATATTMAGVLSGHFMPNLFLTFLNAPQITYYSYLYEQQITMFSILAVTHTTN